MICTMMAFICHSVSNDESFLGGHLMKFDFSVM